MKNSPEARNSTCVVAVAPRFEYQTAQFQILFSLKHTQLPPCI